MDAAESEPDVYRLLTFQVPNLMSLFRCLGRTPSIIPGRMFAVLIFQNKIRFYGQDLLALRPPHQLEDHLLSAVRDCLFNTFAATLHIGGRSSICNLSTHHVIVTAHLSRIRKTIFH
jgi:hypothetical protein